MAHQYYQKWAQNLYRSLTGQKVGKTHLYALHIATLSGNLEVIHCIFYKTIEKNPTDILGTT